MHRIILGIYILHDANPIAPCNHIPDVPHNNNVQPQICEPPPILTDHVPTLTIQHSTQSSALSTNMRESRASEQQLNEAHNMEDDWATDSNIPQAMVTDRP